MFSFYSRSGSGHSFGLTASETSILYRGLAAAGTLPIALTTSAPALADIGEFRAPRSDLRSAGWGVFRRTLAAAAALTAVVTASAPALADFGDAAVRTVLPSTIVVKSDGTKYTHAEYGKNLKAEVEYIFNAHEAGKVKSFGIWLRLRVENGDWVQFKQNKFSQTFAVGSRDNLVIGKEALFLPHSSYSSVVTYYCNKQIEPLRHIGMTDEQIFFQDRPLEMAVDTALEYEMTGFSEESYVWNGLGFGGPDWPTATKFTVVCEKSAPPPPPSAAVTGSAVVVQGVDPANSQGQCQMRLVGSISSNVPNVDVSFRYVDDEGHQSDVKTVNTGGDKNANFEHGYPLIPGQKTARIRIVGENLGFTSPWKDFAYECAKGSVGNLATLLPPEATLLEVGATAKKVIHNGHVCPAEAKMIGAFKGRGAVSGTVHLKVNGALEVERPFDVNDDETKYIDGEYALSWADVQGPLKQQISVDLNIYNVSGKLVDSLTKKKTFFCEKIGEAAIVVPIIPQSNGSLLPAPALAIMAPKGTVRSGQIRLSGGPADATYDLAFYRKVSGVYKLVNSSQLPKQMTGRTATFNLAALDGAPLWRLEVCPVAGGQGSCKTSDFRVPVIGKKKQQAPAEGTPFVIVPGALPQQ